LSSRIEGNKLPAEDVVRFANALGRVLRKLGLDARPREAGDDVPLLSGRELVRRRASE
jgi:hypothetical protein